MSDAFTEGLPQQAEAQRTNKPRKRLQQPDLYAAGVQSVIQVGGKKIRLGAALTDAKPLPTSLKIKQRSTVLQCRWCDEKFNHAPARTIHEKTHTGPQRGQSSLFDLKKIREQASQGQKQREIDVQLRFLMNDLISEVEKIHGPTPIIGKRGKPLKIRKDGRVDGRCNNSGATVRQGRSYAFRWRVIQRINRLKEEYPDFETECAEIVADEYNCTRDQVRKWQKKSKFYEAKAKSKDKKNQRDRKCKGKFAEAEAEVFKQFKEARKQGKRVGPRWLTQCARREVRKRYIGTGFEETAKSFGAKRGWLSRFCRRWKISLRRKTNVKRTPIEERLGKIKRFFALFRRRLASFDGQPGYSPKWSLWPLRNRWSLDQVPAGFFSPTSTYELTGAKRVHIAANGSADSHRECTLQVCIRGWKDPSLPRCGQPKLVICFKGKGKRIAASEIGEYNENCLVQWDPKAWYNERMCMEWATLAACEVILKAEGAHLVLADNLHGQTTEAFKKHLLKHSNATLHNLLAGCTDEIQVVDDGFGALIKFYAQEVSDEWLMVDKNWEEWTKTSLSASRRRVLLTHWYGEGYCRACDKYDFEKHFINVGSGLTADGSDDDKIKLQGLAEFSFVDADADRDPVSGEFLHEERVSLEEEAAAESDDEVEDLSEDSEPSDGEDSNGADSTDDEEEPGVYVPESDYEVVKKYRFKTAKEMMNIHFAYKFTSGWERGRVVGIEKKKDSPDFGLFIVKFVTESCKRCVMLNADDYDADDIWVELKRKK